MHPRSRRAIVRFAAACYPDCVFSVERRRPASGGERAGKKLVALSIDDSPGACTEELLSILRARALRAAAPPRPPRARVRPTLPSRRQSPTLPSAPRVRRRSTGQKRRSSSSAASPRPGRTCSGASGTKVRRPVRLVGPGGTDLSAQPELVTGVGLRAPLPLSQATRSETT